MYECQLQSFTQLRPLLLAPLLLLTGVESPYQLSALVKAQFTQPQPCVAGVLLPARRPLLRGHRRLLPGHHRPVNSSWP